jgi:hypothetical protein
MISTNLRKEKETVQNSEDNDIYQLEKRKRNCSKQ